MLARRNLEEASTSGVIDILSEVENEDLSRAIVLSQEESDREGLNMADMRSLCDDEDEELAIALQESFIYSRKPRANLGTERRWWNSISGRLKIMKKFKQFGQSSWIPTSWKRNNNHQNAFICDVCTEPIHSMWSRYDYWGQMVCDKHESDGTPWCCSCLRFQLGGTRYINLSDGRKICPECHSTAIMDPEQCKPLYNEVYEFFKGLNMKVIRDIPVFLVDQHEINRIFCGHETQKNPQSAPLGVTTYQSQFIIPITGSSWSGQDIEVVKEVLYLPRRYEVTSMLVVYGFPGLATGATLAHEMMHAWMRLEGYRGLEPKVAEGICEVMAHKWLDWHAFVGSEFLGCTDEQAQFLRNLKEFLKDEIERRYCGTYGDGFRDAKWAVERFGLRYTMKNIAATGNFPR